VKGSVEIVRLAEHLGIQIKGCPDKRDLIQEIAASPLVEIIGADGEAKHNAQPKSTKAKLLASKQELNRRLAELKVESRPSDLKAQSRPRSPLIKAGTVENLAGQIMAELRQTGVRLDGQAPEAEATTRNSFTTVGQSIVGGTSRGGA